MIVDKLKIVFKKTAHKNYQTLSYDNYLALKIKDKLKLKIN